MLEYTVYVDVPYHEMMALYKGVAQRIMVRDEQGRSISLPAIKFQPYLSQRGVKGWFTLTTTGEGRFVSLAPLRR